MGSLVRYCAYCYIENAVAVDFGHYDLQVEPEADPCQYPRRTYPQRPMLATATYDFGGAES